MSAPEELFEDPFEAHFRREPMTGAGVRVVVRGAGEDLAAQASRWRSILGNRFADCVALDPGAPLGEAIERAVAGEAPPLVLFADAGPAWNKGHLAPLLKAIDACDHVIGRRPVGSAGRRLRRWLGVLHWRLIFAMPALDVHSPIRLHRREKLAAIPLQSSSDFVDVEILAKATFFGHLIDEVDIPAVDGTPAPRRVAGRDVSAVYRHPTLIRPSGPAEDLEGEDEGDDGPGREDRQGGGDLEQAGTLQDREPQG